MKCLVVDPSPTVRRALVHAAQAIEAAPILVADQPREALQGLEEQLELVMVGWSADDDLGLELVRAVRADARHTGARIVVISPRRTREEVERALQAGADDFVLRPFELEALVKRLRRLAPPAEDEKKEAA
ncbi:MAG TPA: response regulator [Candidatus Sulfotelmatobacter sp.]|nr:response regulator [Candidatus Sulfotelmatobacter sp.]